MALGQKVLSSESRNFPSLASVGTKSVPSIRQGRQPPRLRDDRQDQLLLTKMGRLEADFGKSSPGDSPAFLLRREDLKLVCFEYVSC